MTKPNKEKGLILKRFVFIILILFVFSPICIAEQNEQIVLTVNVTNGTEGGKSPVGDTVHLYIFEHEEPIGTLHGKVGDDGKVTFEVTITEEHQTVSVEVLHDGMSFGRRRVGLKSAHKQPYINVKVFEASYDRSALSAETHHIKITRKGNFLVLSEFMLLRNSSDFAITSKEKDRRGKAVVLKIPLPKGYKNFIGSRYLAPDALGFAEQGFYDTAAVPPGEHEVIFSYELEIEPGSMDITRKVSIPTSSFVIFSQLGSDALRVPGQSGSPLVLPDGIKAQYYNLNRKDAGTEVTFEVVGLSVDKGKENSWIIMSVVFGVILIFAILRLRPVKK